MRPKFSIIIPSKNSSKTIRKLLESIFNAYDKNFFEVIVVDSSNDNTAAILKEFPIRVFKLPFTKKRNTTFSRNLGISKARGNFLYFLDADSFLESNWQIHLKQLIKSELSIFGGKVSTKGSFFDFYCENSIKSPMRHVKKAFKINKSNFYKGTWPIAGNMCVKKDVFKKIGRFDENMESYEEVDFLWRACREGIDIHMFPFIKVIHSYNKSIVEGIKTYFRYGTGCGKFIIKYPKTGLSIFRLLINSLLLCLSLLFLFSTFFAKGNLIYFLIPFVGLFIYYLSKEGFKKKIIPFPLFDLLYAGVSYNMGILYSISKELLKR